MRVHRQTLATCLKLVRWQDGWLGLNAKIWLPRKERRRLAEGGGKLRIRKSGMSWAAFYFSRKDYNLEAQNLFQMNQYSAQRFRISPVPLSFSLSLAPLTLKHVYFLGVSGSQVHRAWQGPGSVLLQVGMKSCRFTELPSHPLAFFKNPSSLLVPGH